MTKEPIGNTIMRNAANFRELLRAACALNPDADERNLEMARIDIVLDELISIPSRGALDSYDRFNLDARHTAQVINFDNMRGKRA